MLVGQALSPAKPPFMTEYRRRLTHFHRDDAYFFLTWHLRGSLPSKPPSLPYATPGRAFVAADRQCGLAGETACPTRIASAVRAPENVETPGAGLRSALRQGHGQVGTSLTGHPT